MPQVKKIKLVAETVTYGSRLERKVQETARSIFAEITSSKKMELYYSYETGPNTKPATTSTVTLTGGA